MGYFEENYNKGNRIDWGVDIENFEYIKIKDLEVGKTYTIHGCFTHKKSNFGETGVLILSDCLLDVPSHKCEEINSLREDEKAIELIKAGKCAIEVYEYKDNKNVDRLSYNLVTLD